MVKGLKTCVNFLLDSDNVKKSEPPTGHNFQNILILKHDFKYCLCPIEGFSLFFGLSWTIKSYYSSQKRGFHLRHPVLFNFECPQILGIADTIATCQYERRMY